MRLEINEKVKTKNSDHKIFCQEEYAQELYDLLENNSISAEESFENNTVSIINGKVETITQKSLYVQSNPKETLVIDISRDQKILTKLGILNIGDDIMFSREDKNEGVASLDKVHKQMMLNKLQKAMNGEEIVFECTVLSRNSGGYFVDIEGVECYLPGSLASANKIINFDSLLGKKVTVMVDSFLKDKNCYIVSAKKWIAKQLPTAIKKLSFEDLYTGEVTGALSTGLFIEFNKIFTAFMHTSEMTPETLKSFQEKHYKPGVSISFYVKEISPSPIKIVVSEKKQENIDWRIMKRDVEDMVISGTVISKEGDIMKVRLSDELISDIPLKNLFKAYSLDKTYSFYVKSIYPDEKKIVLYEIKQQQTFTK